MHYAFTNTLGEEQSRALYDRYHIPASGAIFWGSALANIHPGHDDTWVDYSKHYKTEAITEMKEFEGPHLLPAAPGWEQVADYDLSWAIDHAALVTA